MLSDREQQTLRNVERQLMAEDPRLARSFDDVGRQGSTFVVRWAYTMPRWVYTTAIGAAIALAVLMLAARDPGPALVFAALAAGAMVLRRGREEPGPRSSGHDPGRR